MTYPYRGASQQNRGHTYPSRHTLERRGHTSEDRGTAAETRGHGAEDRAARVAKRQGPAERWGMLGARRERNSLLKCGADLPAGKINDSRQPKADSGTEKMKKQKEPGAWHSTSGCRAQPGTTHNDNSCAFALPPRARRPYSRCFSSRLPLPRATNQSPGQKSLQHPPCAARTSFCVVASAPDFTRARRGL